VREFLATQTIRKKNIRGKIQEKNQEMEKKILIKKKKKIATKQKQKQKSVRKF
jgi:hypothetical protein